MLILGVEEMFLDEDIRLAERRYLFGRILAGASALSRRGLPVLLTCGQSGPSPWGRRLADSARMLPHVQKVLPALSAKRIGSISPIGPIGGRRELPHGPHMAHV